LADDGAGDNDGAFSNQPTAAAVTSPRQRRSLAPLKLLVPYVLRYPWTLAGALLALVLASAATITLPLAIRQIVDVGFGSTNTRLVDQTFILLLLVGILLAVASAARFYCVNRLGELVVADLSRDVFAHLLRLDAAFHEASRSGDLVSRLTGETVRVRDAIVLAVSQSLRNLILLAGSLIMMFGTSAWLSMLVLSAIPVIALPLIFFGRLVRGLSRTAETSKGSRAALAGDMLGQIRLVHAFGQEAAAERRFAMADQAALQDQMQRLGGRSLLTSLVIGLVFCSIILVLWHGTSEVLAGTMSAGTLLQFVLFAVFAAGSLAELSEVWTGIEDAAGATERLAEILVRVPAIRVSTSPKSMPRPARGELRFDRVSFAYPGSGQQAGVGALEQVDFTIQAGETVALVGPSGSGKSTIFNLLLRHFDPNSGSIRIDGVDARDADLGDWRRHLALVPQDTALIGATLMEAIRFGRPEASAVEVTAAAVAAQADTFIRALPQGYDTPLGERGATLSGGQRQRVAIARALLVDAPILLLDEATSALDSENEAAVREALILATANRTTLIIAHRLATIEQAQRILVLDRGRLIAAGRHDELARTSSRYAGLLEAQFRSASAT
jgi:ATP-binding cassette, subfamily B, bacterial